MQEQHVFSPHLLNTARVGFSRASFYFLGSTPHQQCHRPGWVQASPSEPSSSPAPPHPTAPRRSPAPAPTSAPTTPPRATSSPSTTTSSGRTARHQIEAGGWIQRLQSNDNLAQNQYGQASFASLTTFLQGTVKTFTVVPAPTELGWRSTLGRRLPRRHHPASPRASNSAPASASNPPTASTSHKAAPPIYGFTNGVINTNPTVGSSALTINSAKFLPEPRLGLAWDVFGNGKTAVRAGFGMHHSLLDNLDYRLDQAAPFNTTLSLSNVPVSSLNITSPPHPSAGTLISPSNVQPDIHTPTVLSWTFKIEQQIAPNTSLTVGYIGSHGYHQILSEDLNEPAAIICSTNNCPAGVASGTIYYPTTIKANPLLANTTSWVSQGISNYNGLEVDVRRSFTHGLQFRGNYTFSKNLDNGSAWNTSVSANTPAFVSVPLQPQPRLRPGRH